MKGHRTVADVITSDVETVRSTDRQIRADGRWCCRCRRRTVVRHRRHRLGGHHSRGHRVASEEVTLCPTRGDALGLALPRQGVARGGRSCSRS